MLPKCFWNLSVFHLATKSLPSPPTSLSPGMYNVYNTKELSSNECVYSWHLITKYCFVSQYQWLCSQMGMHTCSFLYYMTNQSESHSGHHQLRFTRNYMGAWRTWRRPPTSSLLLDWSCRRTRRRRRHDLRCLGCNVTVKNVFILHILSLTWYMTWIEQT